MTPRAVDVAVELGRVLGLRVDEPRVLGVAPNAVVHLAPAPVVAKVPTTFALLPLAPDWVGRQLRAATHLRDSGIPVAAPTTLVPPGPHVRHGCIVGFWEYADHDRRRPLDVEAAIRSLRRMQDALASYTAPLPHFARLDELARVLDVVERESLLTAAQLGLLRSVHESLSSQLPDLDVPLQPVHGDTHLGNVLRTPEGPLWSDFDTICSGPRELDALSLAVRARLHGDPDLAMAVRAYGPYDGAVAAAVEPYLALYLCCWNSAMLAGRPEIRPMVEQRLAWLRDLAR
jgi:Ser/Thr protein kinase RdoA (MazF antagonist)